MGIPYCEQLLVKIRLTIIRPETDERRVRDSGVPPVFEENTESCPVSVETESGSIVTAAVATSRSLTFDYKLDPAGSDVRFEDPKQSGGIVRPVSPGSLGIGSDGGDFGIPDSAASEPLIVCLITSRKVLHPIDHS